MKVALVFLLVILVAVAVQTAPVAKSDKFDDEVGDSDFYQGPFGGLIEDEHVKKHSDDEVGDWDIFQGPLFGIPKIFE